MARVNRFQVGNLSGISVLLANTMKYRGDRVLLFFHVELQNSLHRLVFAASVYIPPVLSKIRSMCLFLNSSCLQDGASSVRESSILVLVNASRNIEREIYNSLQYSTWFVASRVCDT